MTEQIIQKMQALARGPEKSSNFWTLPADRSFITACRVYVSQRPDRILAIEVSISVKEIASSKEMWVSFPRFSDPTNSGHNDGHLTDTHSTICTKNPCLNNRSPSIDVCFKWWHSFCLTISLVDSILEKKGRLDQSWAIRLVLDAFLSGAPLTKLLPTGVDRCRKPGPRLRSGHAARPWF